MSLLLSLLYSLGSDHKENTLIVALAPGTDHKENISAESAQCCHKEETVFPIVVVAKQHP
jgi:hypothetical protein